MNCYITSYLNGLKNVKADMILWMGWKTWKSDKILNNSELLYHILSLWVEKRESWYNYLNVVEKREKLTLLQSGLFATTKCRGKIPKVVVKNFLRQHVVVNTSSQINRRKSINCDDICCRNCICNDNRHKKVAANMSFRTSLIWCGIDFFTMTVQKSRRKNIPKINYWWRQVVANNIF